MQSGKPTLVERAKDRLRDLRRLQDAGFLCRQGDFFPSVHYPPITMVPSIAEEELFGSYRNPEDGLYDIYVHIPFCEKQCDFCHYPVKLGASVQEKDRYLDALEKELDLHLGRLGLRALPVRSILVGGGTPTHLTPAQLKRFLGFLISKLDRSSLTQFNYDLDPGSLLGPAGRERIELLRAHAVDRLSIGIQSLDDAMLRRMNRPHDASQAVESVRLARAAGFITNVEFIFGYPGQTISGWVDTLSKAVDLEADEIQLYRLKIHPYGDRKGTISARYEHSPATFPSVDGVLTMKMVAMLFLSERGYCENLRRVFSRKPEIYSHYADNQCCRLRDQIGLGLTAFSSLRDRFGLNMQSFGEYYASIGRGRLPLNRGLVRSREDQLRWAIILPLKNRSVRKRQYQGLTGVSLDSVFRKKIAKLKQAGLLWEDAESLGLTELGSFLADEICHQFHAPEYIPFPRAAYAPGELNPYMDCEP
ncbi:MAG TPA: radical SAM protein [Elusimicrobia bacterium]|nr:radical SAM protein [Elusimicrobiota bacterium]